MGTRVLNCVFPLLLTLVFAVFLPEETLAQSQSLAAPGALTLPPLSLEKAQPETQLEAQPQELEVSITGPGGTPFTGAAELTIAGLDGEIYRIETVSGGHARLGGLPDAEYGTIQVEAGGFMEITRRIEGPLAATPRMKLVVELQQMGEGEKEFSRDAGVLSLPPKAEQALGKAFESLGHNAPAEAQRHMEEAYRLAPNNAEVNYVYGVFAMQTSRRDQAKSYWAKTLEVYPQHYRALISLSKLLVDENKPADALAYLDRAVRADPNSWRAHAIYADAYLRQGKADEAANQAEQALELDPLQAAVVQRHLAAALAKRGEKEKAIQVLQTYLREHHSDHDAKAQLKKLQSPESPVSSAAAEAAQSEPVEPSALDGLATLPMPATWLPPDIDRRVPRVEPGASCSVEEVVRKTGERIKEFVGDVDRFTATEFLTHESINKWGVGSWPEKKKFDYLVSVEEVAPQSLSVTEYRTDRNSPRVEFPGGIETRGLPALVLIFHPYNSVTFDMSCEGLTHLDGQAVWQVHFKQRSDKPNRIREYRLGLTGPAYAIALKGRAWIDADTYQIKKLETDLVAGIPEIQLVADHTAIEYGPVRFKNRDVVMWLPQTAEVYYAWRGKRTYRRHSFSNYMLFSVDEKQKIAAPKNTEQTSSNSSNETRTSQP